MDTVLSSAANQLAIFTSGQDWLIILLVIVILFGGSKIPQLMRGVGRGIGEFQEGLKDTKEKISQGLRTDDSTTEHKSG